MKLNVKIDKKMVEIDVAPCCYENSPINILERPDLKPTKNTDIKICYKCKRRWKKCIKYVGANLQVSSDWVPMPFRKELDKASNVEKRLREKAGNDAFLIIKEVKECPDYFITQGGADKTFSHNCFLNDYGHLLPEIIEFAKECGGKV